jgi:hypothetical protein
VLGSGCWGGGGVRPGAVGVIVTGVLFVRELWCGAATSVLVTNETEARSVCASPV